MAQTGFQIQNWQRGSTGANEPVQTDSGLVNGCFREYLYYSPVDTQATCSASGYFNNVNTDLVTGDQIKIYSLSENTYVTYQVTNTNGVITLTNVSTGGGVSSYAQVALTAAQIKALYDTPVLLVAAPGSGLLLLVDKFVLNVVYGTTQYTAGGVLAPQYTNTVHGGGTVATSATIAAATINGITANSIVGLTGLLAVTSSAALINTGLYLSNASADFATGDSTAVANIWYRTVTAS